MTTPTSGVEALRDGLPPLQRLALSYAPADARLPTLALLALDMRLAGLVRNSREPMLAQLRLSWWREQLSMDAAEWPEGEPLLAALRSWQGHHKPLAALCDGWEHMTGAAPLPPSAFDQFAQARGTAFAALAEALDRSGESAEAARLGREWAAADIAVRVAHPQERAAALELAFARGSTHGRLSRKLRPLLVLHGLAVRRLEEPNGAPWRDLLIGIRLGLLGR